jgi:chromosome segregation protein
MKADMRNWQARAGDAAKRLAQMATRAEELAQERAVSAAKPAGLIAEIEQGEAIARALPPISPRPKPRWPLPKPPARPPMPRWPRPTKRSPPRAKPAPRPAPAPPRRPAPPGNGRHFRRTLPVPAPLLAERFAFASADVGEAAAESATHERLLAERERIGPVNLVAAEELAQAEARQAESLAEQAELAEAVNRLRGSIGNLNREGRERLRAAFEAVDGHFRRLFTRLFGGGEAHLALVDSDDPLEAGLEIMAQPPGKRLQSLTLLSGGEQALTAVALIFGLFLTNPAPICVLDEVDAPLDDANIERFCDLLDTMVGETQTRYLIVTHNAVTMSRMHRLFGVTMVERGVSRLVSVDLGGAEELLAQAV